MSSFVWILEVFPSALSVSAPVLKVKGELQFNKMGSQTPEWQTSFKTIQGAIKHLLESGKLSDVTFVVGSEKARIPAHKFILMARSSAFQVIFESWGTGVNHEVHISEVGSNSLKKFLDFLYTDNVELISGKVTEEVLFLAHMYSVPELAQECLNLLSQSIVVKNAVNLNRIATLFEREDLRKQTEEFILRHGRAVFLDCGFLDITEDALCALLKKDNLGADELTVFRAVMRWADNQCRLLGLQTTTENKREVLKNLLHLIRFPLMSPKEFTDEVITKNKGILTDKEALLLYMHFHTVFIFTKIPENWQNSTRLPLTARSRAPCIVACLNLIKPCTTDTERWSKCDLQMLQTQNLCRKRDVNGYPNIAVICETTISIYPDRDIRLQEIVLERDHRKSSNAQLIRSFTKKLTEEYKRNKPNYFDSNHEFKSFIWVSLVDSSGARIPILVKEVEDNKKIEFENGIDVGKNQACNLKLIVTSSNNLATSNEYIQASGQNEPERSTLSYRKEEVTCEELNDVVTFTISSQDTKCAVLNHNQSREHECVTNLNCISAGHIKSVNFTISPDSDATAKDPQ